MSYSLADSRMSLLNTLYQQLLANHITNALSSGTNPRFSPPPLRYPNTFNPFLLQRPASAGHATPLPGGGYGMQLGGGAPTHSPLQLVGQTDGAPVGARNWFGPPPSATGIGGPHFSPPAMRPGNVPPLPGH